MKSPLAFLSDVRHELHKVQWPTQAQTWRYTLLVVAISVVMAIYLGALDKVFGAVVQWVIGNA